LKLLESPCLFSLKLSKANKLWARKAHLPCRYTTKRVELQFYHKVFGGLVVMLHSAGCQVGGLNLSKRIFLPIIRCALTMHGRWWCVGPVGPTCQCYVWAGFNPHVCYGVGWDPHGRWIGWDLHVSNTGPTCQWMMHKQKWQLNMPHRQKWQLNMTHRQNCWCGYQVKELMFIMILPHKLWPIRLVVIS
jgi:hypothetical protein